MRMTPTIQTRNFLERIQDSKARLDKAQEEVSTGKSVNRLSDDPYAAGQLSEITATMSMNDQFISNNDQLKSKLELTDSVLQLLNQAIDGAKGLAAQALSGTTTAESRQALALAVDGVKKEVLSDSNAQYNGMYLFSGTQTSSQPFVDSGGGAIAYQGNDEPIYLRLDRSTVLQTNITGGNLFLGSPGIYSTLDDLKTAISNNDTATIQSKLQDLETISDRVNAADTTVGNHLQLLDQIQSRLNSQNLALQTESSRLGDANLVESLSNLTLANQAVNVTLNTEAQVQQLSLIDYLR
ncbi:MAG: flagellar hook-associated protein FlgL [Terriglobia bacterium]